MIEHSALCRILVVGGRKHSVNVLIPVVGPEEMTRGSCVNSLVYTVVGSPRLSAPLDFGLKLATVASIEVKKR